MIQRELVKMRVYTQQLGKEWPQPSKGDGARWWARLTQELWRNGGQARWMIDDKDMLPMAPNMSSS